jgi:transposase
MQAVNGDPVKTPPGVNKNSHGGYQFHIKLNERHTSPIIGGEVDPGQLAPPETPLLSRLSVFEDVVVLELAEGQSLIVHVSEPEVKGSVVFFYHTNGRLWRAEPLEELNPGWVKATYHFRGDLGKFEARLARIRSQGGLWPEKKKVTFWQTGAWSAAVVYTATGLVYRLKGWQHSQLPEVEVETVRAEQVESLSEAYPADVQPIIMLQEEGVEKQSYQIGGVRLVLKYIERVGLIEIVNRYCPRQPDKEGVTDGEVIAVLVINRLLGPCALSKVAAWLEKESGLHLLLGIAEPQKFNYDRLADALLSVNEHWQEIGAEITLRAVKAFGLQVETVHYDLTSILFQGQYQGSAWVDYGYSRDHRPDKPQVNLGLSATADGEVVLPGGSGIHRGNTNDATTTIGTHRQLRRLFQRTDILVTGDRIMQSAGNMLTIIRAHGRLLGPTTWTPELRQIVAACDEAEFRPLPLSSATAGHEIKATFRWLPFKVKEEMTPAQRQRTAHWRKKQGLRGRVPKKREVRFRMRAAIILDPQRQQTDAARRQKRVEAYQVQLDQTRARLNKKRYYNDPDWVANHLADLAVEFKDVRDFVKVTFSQQEGLMKLEYQLWADKIEQAAQLDGRWMLVTNQPPEPGQSQGAYLDWMVNVYKNHRHIERRMRNLKSDLPIRPIYAHRDEVIVPLCFVCVLALMLYTLIERDCQANPTLVEAGLTTTDQLLNALSGYGLTLFLTPSGYQVFWFDTPTQSQVLIWKQFDLPNPGNSAPIVCPCGQWGETHSVFCFSSARRKIGPDQIILLLLILIQKGNSGSLFSCQPIPLPDRDCLAQMVSLLFFAIVKVLIVMLC